jgi:hypothetical protein
MTFPVLTQWIANALVVLFFPFAFHVIGKEVTFGFLMLMCLGQGVFTWLYVPETGNKSLEEMEDHWAGLKRRPGGPQAERESSSESSWDGG